MKHNEKAEFGKMMAKFSELYGKQMSPMFLAIYWEMLQPYSIEELEWAARCHMADPNKGQFMPKPADFFKYLKGHAHEKALEAWSKVLTAAKTIGAYDSVIFEDLLIHHVIGDMGGWITLCHANESKLPFLFQEFSRRYTMGLRLKPKDPPQKLSGLHALDKARLISQDC